jgi:hypothetical protein
MGDELIFLESLRQSIKSLRGWGYGAMNLFSGELEAKHKVTP